MKAKEKVKVIRAGNITVASGIECDWCGVVRSFSNPECNCKKQKYDYKPTEKL